MAGFLDSTVQELLDGVASKAPAPGSGSVAALVAALAAALTAMAARASTEWESAGGIAAQAEALRARLTPLAPANADAFETALASLTLPPELESEVREYLMRESLDRAAALPLAIADAAANVAELAAVVAEEGNATFRADAAAAARLAEGAARAAAHLVEINLGVTVEDERLVLVRKLIEDAAEAARRATAAGV